MRSGVELIDITRLPLAWDRRAAGRRRARRRARPQQPPRRAADHPRPLPDAGDGAPLRRVGPAPRYGDGRRRPHAAHPLRVLLRRRRPVALAGRVRFLARTVRDMRSLVRAATGAHFCEVRVDSDTGEVRVSRWLGAFDVGRVINPKLVGSQLRGGIVMGLGMALMERTLVDPRTGRIVNASLAGYHVPAHADAPEIDVRSAVCPAVTRPGGSGRAAVPAGSPPAGRSPRRAAPRCRGCGRRRARPSWSRPRRRPPRRPR